MEWKWFKIPFFVVFRSLESATIDKDICIFCLDMITGTRNGSCRTNTGNLHIKYTTLPFSLVQSSSIEPKQYFTRISFSCKIKTGVFIFSRVFFLDSYAHFHIMNFSLYPFSL